MQTHSQSQSHTHAHTHTHANTLKLIRCSDQNYRIVYCIAYYVYHVIGTTKLVLNLAIFRHAFSLARWRNALCAIVTYCLACYSYHVIGTTKLVWNLTIFLCAFSLARWRNALCASVAADSLTPLFCNQISFRSY